MKEVWKTVIYQGQKFNNFEVSNLGKIRNVSTGNVLKQYINPKGYCQVCVSLGDKNNRKLFKIHKAVAETFIPNPENKSDVNHKDANKTNNHIDNLEWMTEAENTQHAWDNGLCSARKGTDNTLSKLTEEQVRFIRASYIPRDKEFGSRALARRFNVDKARILDVIHYRTYTNVI